MAEDRKVTFPTTEQLIEKWLPVLECKDEWADVCYGAPKIADHHYENVAKQLELTEQLVLEDTVSGDVAKFNPILIPMIRRVMPSLIGMEIFGTQPMSGPTGLIFALRSSYHNSAAESTKRANSVILNLASVSGLAVGTALASEGGAKGKALYIESTYVLASVSEGTFAQAEKISFADTYSGPGNTTISSVVENEALFKHVFKNYSGRMSTAAGEVLGTSTKEMGFDIQSTPVTAETRRLNTRWSNELNDDLKAVHGMDAETLLSGITTDEIIMEMNREFIDMSDAKAILGGVTSWNYATADGRWEVEKYQNLAATISRTSRAIAVASRRGQGNWMIVSPSVLAALEMTGKLSTSGTDPMVSSFAGIFNGYIKTCVDIFATENYVIMGYKGASEVDAGLFYAPYVPLKIERGMDPSNGQPKLFFRTRYGIAENPFGSTNYFRKIVVQNLPL